jgi:hypothetical protein
MWLFWGTKEALTGSIRVEGVQVNSGQKKSVLMENNNLVWEYAGGLAVGSLNGEDTSLPSTMMLGDAGSGGLMLSLVESSSAAFLLRSNNFGGFKKKNSTLQKEHMFVYNEHDSIKIMGRGLNNEK